MANYQSYKKIQGDSAVIANSLGPAQVSGFSTAVTCRMTFPILTIGLLKTVDAVATGKFQVRYFQFDLNYKVLVDLVLDLVAVSLTKVFLVDLVVMR